MGLFGKKDEDKKDGFQLTDEDLDAKILAAIEETDEEEKQRKEEVRSAEARRVAEQTASLPQEEAAPAANRPKRFFFMVEKTETVEEGLALTGILHGIANVGDSAFLCRPDDSCVKIEIVAMAKAGGESVNTIQNEGVVLFVKFADGQDISDAAKAAPKFSVLSNVEPQKDINPQKPVENPYLLGLSLEHKRFLNDREYMKHFARQIILGKFILPVHAQMSDVNGQKKKLQLITLTEKNDPSAKYLAVFTDLAAIGGAKGIFADDKKPSVTVMTFPALAKALGNELKGMQINPFGPAKVQVPREFVENVMGSVSVANRQKKVSPLPGTKKDLPHILVGKPPVNEETDNLRKALVEYAATVPDLASATLLFKADKTQRGYLVVVDCPAASQKKVFDGVKKALTPHMKDVKNLESVLYAQAPFAPGYFKSNEPDYAKK